MTPAAPPTAEPSVPPAPAASAPARVLRRLGAPLRYARRRPRRALLVAAVGLLFTAAAAGVGTWVWFDHHLAVARREVAAGHNAAAHPHLEACRGLYPDHPEVLVLAARVARRSGVTDEAELLLARHPRGDADDAVVLER
ncbi:tetratricopeptide repeat protein, partial [bacterium]|nr:tetratricopeptide repeat protein [bacterium]